MNQNRWIIIAGQHNKKQYQSIQRLDFDRDSLY